MAELSDNPSSMKIAETTEKTMKMTLATATAIPKQLKQPTHPPVKEMIYTALLELRERSGSSLHALKKFMVAKYNIDTEKLGIYIKKSLKMAVENGELIQTKGRGANGSFKLPPKSKKKEAVVKTKKKEAIEKPKSKKTDAKTKKKEAVEKPKKKDTVENPKTQDVVENPKTKDETSKATVKKKKPEVNGKAKKPSSTAKKQSSEKKTKKVDKVDVNKQRTFDGKRAKLNKSSKRVSLMIKQPAMKATPVVKKSKMAKSKKMVKIATTKQ